MLKIPHEGGLLRVIVVRWIGLIEWSKLKATLTDYVGCTWTVSASSTLRYGSVHPWELADVLLWVEQVGVSWIGLGVRQVSFR